MLLTRLELFLRQHGLRPLHVARRAKYSRQHFLRLRLGEQMPTARAVSGVAAACRSKTRKVVQPEQLFERADELLRRRLTRLGMLHKADLAQLDRLLEDVQPEGWAETVLATGIRSETAARHLLLSGLTAIDAAPAAAAEVFRAAMLLAADLPASAPELVSALSAHALKGRANALRHLGRFEDALSDLALAGKLFTTARYCDAEAGQVEFSRAGILFKQERWSEALIAARAAGERFLAAKDVRRAAHAEIVEGGILFEQGSTDAAREVFHRLRTTLRRLRDHEALARIWLNLAACEIRRGDSVSARHWLTRASRTFRQRGQTSEFLRTRWSMGIYIATFRTRARGVRLLRRVERSFHLLGMDADAACVGLDILELLIDLDASRTDLGAQATAIATAFTAAGMAVSLAAALDNLRRIHASPNPRAVLHDVRAVIRAAEDVPCGDPPGEEWLEIGGAPDL